jgi:glycosyl hydrolase family 44
MRAFQILLCTTSLMVLAPGLVASAATNAAVTVQVDAAADRHAISPLIYGVAFATSNQLKDLNVPLNRSGGNSTTRYNWTTNASNHANDWYFESLQESGGSVPGATVDEFISDSKNGGAQAAITVPIIGWVAKLGPNSQRLSSFATNKYGVQTDNDWQWFPTAGNGILASSGQDITTNDPTDANLSVGTNFEAGWIQHLTNRWGAAAGNGVRYYIMDNEWSIWHSTHRDVHPIGATMDEVLGKFCDYAALVKGMDSNALVFGPEEWGWSGYLYSGYDQQYGSQHGWSSFPDRAAHGNQDYMPWLLNQIHQRSTTAGKRLLDVFTLHFYPQGGETANDDVSTATQLLRNRSTRGLWDTNYTNESWIGSVVKLIPRMKQWVATNYPGTMIGITEYNWGAEAYPNGGTAQADVLGIFGREGLDLATRWTTPGTGTPAYNAIKMFRNYDGNKSVFGDINIRATVPNPDNLAAFASVRSSDGELTLIVINKDLQNYTPANFSLTNVPPNGVAQVWQLLAGSSIVHLADNKFTNGVLSQTLPAQSITMFVLPATTQSTLRFGTNSGPGQLELWLNGQAARTYVLQSSTDMVQWLPVSTNTLSSNSFRFLMPATNPPQMYYRGWLSQP